jgi:alanyl-tRNA synthetase
MNSKEIRQTFLDFFASKGHVIVPSAPMVVKNDPTLMFTNAGMNQFKDIFLGNSQAKNERVADTQKCLRVSGKHNDLEEVGHDTYHHTMFEMLGNWSFGNYFKQEAIKWSWELLADIFGISKDKLYVTVFEGDEQDGVPMDTEAYNYWLEYLPADRILKGNKKDNFWEMGESGPCGPCSEIHADIRDDNEKAKVAGRDLVNTGHPRVIEIWNLVFIQFNRRSNGELVELPAKHVDTGMGFERLCMVIQGKQSNYDTDVFQNVITRIGYMAGKKYGAGEKPDIAMRVIADHLRAISFAITDGQLPSNNKAGYVIRRILRRAVRYGYTFLDFRKPFIHQLVNVLAETMGDAFPELIKQQELVVKVVREEEDSFLRTLETGIRMLDAIIAEAKEKKEVQVSGDVAFELYDTFGFPLDLTGLILREQGLTVDHEGFELAMEAQKSRSRSATQLATGDWNELQQAEGEGFVGYDTLEAQVRINRYRKVKGKKGEYFQLVFNTTPFYAESGGQTGDSGTISDNGITTEIFDTVKENDLTVHLVNNLPPNPEVVFTASVNSKKRMLTENNHTATHILHHALREILGNHIEQKGSLVSHDSLRFDFNHFQKVTNEELHSIQQRVNELIRANNKREERREVPVAEAESMGAIALFGEKYGDNVRVIRFGQSVELCGGTHVEYTGTIGQFIILSEGSISAGIRRIEAITAEKAEEYVSSHLKTLKEVESLFNNPADLVAATEDLFAKCQLLTRQVEDFEKGIAGDIKKALLRQVEPLNGINFLAQQVKVNNAGIIKDISFQLKGEIENLFLVLAAEIDGKANIHVMISDNLIKERALNAGNIIRELAKAVNGGGGGQPFYATAGGKEPAGIPQLIRDARKLIL